MKISKSNPINSDEAGTQPPWYRQFWPWFLIILPGCVIIASLGTLFLALKTADSLVIDNYYREGLAVNRQLEFDTRASELKLSAKISLDAENGEVRVSLDNANMNNPDIKKTPLKIEFLHARNEAEDIRLILQPTPQGDWLANLPKPLIGQWYIRLSNATDKQTEPLAAKNTLWRLQESVFLGAADKTSSTTELIVIKAEN